MLNSGGRLIVLTLSISIILLPFFYAFEPTPLAFVVMNVSNKLIDVVVLCLLSLGDASLSLLMPFHLNFEFTTILGSASGGSCLISKGCP